MLVNQLAVFLENKKGRLCSLTAILAENKIDLIAMSIADTKEYGIVRLITSDNKKAMACLKDAGFVVTNNDMIGIEVEDKPGGLADLLKEVEKCNIDIEYLYSFARTKQGKAIILFKADKPDETIEILKKSANVKLISSMVD